MYAPRLTRRHVTRRAPQPARIVAVVAIATLAFSACSGERFAEEGIERAIERETGEDIEFDFGGDNGFSFESDEGSIRIGEDGSIIVEGPDGEVFTGEANDDDFTITGEDGSIVFEADNDAGSFRTESEDGSFSAGPGFPDNWPDAVPRPEGLADINHTVITGDGQMFVGLTGAAADVVEYFDAYSTVLGAAGYERSSYFEGDGLRQGLFAGPYGVNVVGEQTSSMITITVTKVP